MKTLIKSFFLFLTLAIFSAPAAVLASEAWGPPATIVTTSGTADDFDLGVDAAGNTIAVYADDGDVYYLTKPFGGSWSAPAIIAGSSDVFDISLTVDPAGNAVLVALDFTNGVLAATLPFGGSWSAYSTISFATTTSDVQVGSDPAGNAVAVWYDSFTGFVTGATLPFGGSWTAAVQISTVANDFQSVIALSVDVNGNAVVVWNDAGQTDLVTSTLPFGGSWSAPIALATGNSFVRDIHTGIDDAGITTVVWTAFDGSNTLLYSANLPLSGAWGSQVQVSASGLSVDGGIDVAVDGAGNATTVWGSDSTNVLSAVKPFGGSWAAPVLVEVANAFNVNLAHNPSDGTVVAIWGVLNDVRSAQLPLGGAWGTVTDVDSSVSGEALPLVVMDPSGNATGIWNQADSKGGFIDFRSAETLLTLPYITDMTPVFGPTAGGTVVTITGINFTGATQVFFGLTPAASFIVNSDNSITAVSPPHPAGPVDVTIVTPAGTSPITLAGVFTFIPPGEGVLPPASFSGKRGGDRFLTQTDYFNRLVWTASPSIGIAVYRIYRNGSLLVTIPADDLLEYIDHNRSKYGQDTYAITAVNGLDEESTALVITLPN